MSITLTSHSCRTHNCHHVPPGPQRLSSRRGLSSIVNYAVMMSHSLTPCLAATDYQSVAMQNPDQGRVIDNDSGAEIMLNCCLKLITEQPSQLPHVCPSRNLCQNYYLSDRVFRELFKIDRMPSFANANAYLYKLIVFLIPMSQSLIILDATFLLSRIFFVSFSYLSRTRAQSIWELGF